MTATWMAPAGPLIALAIAMTAVSSLRADDRPRQNARLAPTQSAATTGTGLLMGVIVESESGQPVAGALVTLSEGDRLARTAAKGQFIFTDLPKGAYRISASKAGYSDGAYGRRRPDGPAQMLPLADGERIGDVKIPIWRDATVSGTIADESGEPMVDLAVRAMRQTIVAGRRLLTPLNAVKTDDRGVYLIDALIPGDYVVVVPSTQTSAPESVVDLYREAQAAYRSSRGAGGGVTDPHRDFAASGAGDALDLILRSGGFNVAGLAFQSSTTTAGAGIVPQPSRDGRIFIYPTRYYPAALTSAGAVAITLRSGEERTGVDLQLKLAPTVRVSGSVTGPDGPLSVGLSLVSDSNDVSTMANLETAITISDAAGRFTFLGVPPGTYLLRASKVPPGPSRGTPPPSVPADPTLWATQPVVVDTSDIADVVVTLRTGFRVTGRLEFDDITTQPPPDVVRRIVVTFESADGRPLPSPTLARGLIDTNSQFSSYQLPTGRYYLRPGSLPAGWTWKSATVEGRDISTVPLTLDHDVTHVVVTLTNHPGELSGRVRNAAGIGDANASVLVFPTRTDEWIDYGNTPRQLRSIRVDKDGGYRAVGLPAGDYFVVAIADEAAADWANPSGLPALAQLATAVTLADRESRSVDLKTVTVRR